MVDHRGPDGNTVVMVANVDGAAGKVDVHVEVEVPRHAALHDRAEPPQQERVDHPVLRVVDRESSIGLDERAELKPVVAVVALDYEGGHRLGRCGCGAQQQEDGGEGARHLLYSRLIWRKTA